MKRWTNDNVVEFVNWYLKIFNLPTNYQLKNKDIIRSFKRGDDYKIWQNEEQLLNHDHIKELIESGYKLKAVKYVKDNTSWSLLEAKNYIDNYNNRL